MIIKTFSASLILAAALSTSALSTSALAAAPAYRLVKLASPVGAPSSVARAISANGTIAGESFLSANATGNTPVSYGSIGALSTQVLSVPSGTTNGFLRGVNDSGVASGTVQDNVAISSRAILARTGGFTTLAGLSGFANAGATGINNGGTAVGYSMSIGIFNAEGTARPINSTLGGMTATVWDSLGNATALANPFGNFNSLATAVNASGQVVGAANRVTSAISNAVVWNNGVATALLTATTERSTARAISSVGWIGGRTDQLSDGTYLGSIWDGAGAKYTLGTTAGCDSSDVRGVNASRIAVGFSQQGDCANGPGSAGNLWAWNGAGFTGYDINSLVINLGGWNLYAPQAINDAGQIVGFGSDELGMTRAFVLTAVPEPSSWALLIAGFGLTGAAMRRRRMVAA